jgi:hypothetical protein
MVLWQITSYATALDMEARLRRAHTVLRARHGRRWRREAPADLVWMLRVGPFAEKACALVESLTISDRPAVAELGEGDHRGTDVDLLDVMMTSTGLLVVELAGGLPSSVALTSGGRDLDNYLCPLVKRLGPARFRAAFGRKFHGAASSLAVSPAEALDTTRGSQHRRVLRRRPGERRALPHRAAGSWD